MRELKERKMKEFFQIDPADHEVQAIKMKLEGNTRSNEETDTSPVIGNR